MRRFNMLALTLVGWGAILQVGCSEELGTEDGDDPPSANQEIASTQQALVTPGGSNHNMMLTKCSNEFETCVLGTSKLVAFGKHPNFIYKSFSQPFACVNSSFGGPDPAPGVTKACYYTPYAFDKNENESGSFEGTIAFGANGKFNFIHNEKSGGGEFPQPRYTCSLATFGGAANDPAPGVTKACYRLADYKFSVKQGSSFNTLLTPVAYGAAGHFTYKVVSGNLTCSDATFGDPNPGVAKACYVLRAPLQAFENQAYNVGTGSLAEVFYGSGTNGNWMGSSQFQGTCSNTFFGGDPAVGLGKGCWGEQRLPPLIIP